MIKKKKRYIRTYTYHFENNDDEDKRGHTTTNNKRGEKAAFLLLLYHPFWAFPSIAWNANMAKAA